jgi:hypothetical protein
MDKVRISEVALELGMETKAVLSKAQEMSLNVKAANSAIINIITNIIEPLIN